MGRVPRPIRVYIAEQHPIFREAVAEGFRAAPEINLVGIGTNGEEAVGQIAALHPEVAVTGLTLPKLWGVPFLRHLSQISDGVKVVLLSGITDENMIFSAVASGVAGYLLKTVTMDELISTVIRVSKGETVFSPEISKIIALRINTKNEGLVGLTPRENQILRFLSEGWTTPQIASKLSISKSTVKAHRHNIYRKLGVTNQTAAVLEGIRQNIIQEP